jgi:hypothetical protein
VGLLGLGLEIDAVRQTLVEELDRLDADSLRKIILRLEHDGSPDENDGSKLKG